MRFDHRSQRDHAREGHERPLATFDKDQPTVIMVSWTGAARIVGWVARRAGIAKPIGPHTLRHTFITATLDAAVPLRDVQEAASHADPRTTMP